MTRQFNRRDALKMSASFALSAAAGGLSCVEIAKAGPIEVYLPVLMFAVLFGLSMDYEVFLVSRMHEEWVTSHDNHRAVTRGLAETGRVITAAALIMILVWYRLRTRGERKIESAAALVEATIEGH